MSCTGAYFGRRRKKALLCAVCKERDSGGSRKDLPTRRPPISPSIYLSFYFPSSPLFVLYLDRGLACNRQSLKVPQSNVAQSLCRLFTPAACGPSVGIASDRRKAFVSRRKTPLSPCTTADGFACLNELGAVAVGHDDGE